MANKSITLDGFTVQYGKTTVRELLDRGYTISDFEQIIEEPALANCHLKKDKALVATLSFWDIKEKITQEQLYEVPIDLVLLEKSKRKKPNPKLTPPKAFQKRITWTILIHCIAAVIFFCVYSFPVLFSWVQKAEFHAGGGSAPMGIVLLILPAFLITFFIWGGANGEKGALKKIALAFGLILNVVVSLAYLVLIDNLFTHRFF